ncbi:bifunctional transaldolase/phosoglucose isomerase, partial [Dehalococcoidia bacterium]|nr:bifunctional transaldolase/phosoglucose isomerase [Dehalococcoidia bacterium]
KRSRDGYDSEKTFEALAIEDIRAAADLLMPIFDRTEGADGFASLEVNPNLAHDAKGTVSEARRLFATIDRPNVMIKVPATPEGIPAVKQLISEGININITLIFSLKVYQQVREAYISGLETLARSGGDVSKVASVASFFVSRVDTVVDGLIDEYFGGRSVEMEQLKGKAAVSNVRLAYRDFKNTFTGPRFARIHADGARPQRPLWASTSTKNPAYSDVLYVEALIGPDTVNTMPDGTLNAFLDHGSALGALEADVNDAQTVMDLLEAAGVSMDTVTENLLVDGVSAFADSYEQLTRNIAYKQGELLSHYYAKEQSKFDTDQPQVAATLARMRRARIVGRIWERDHTVWKQAPSEISNRLGWLGLPGRMRSHLKSILELTTQVQMEEIRHVVVLGMGGSSLGAEVLRRSLPHSEGFPELMVLGSTVPASVRVVRDKIDVASTLFIVSSKSGTTVETNALYRYFRGLMEAAIGSLDSGEHFIAITDSGTPLDLLAREQRFRKVFKSHTDVGGRYSVLSDFGIVPAALYGIDVVRLLGRARAMQMACSAEVDALTHPGLQLGSVIGSMALNGRDKLTIVTSPGVESLGRWLEQLIAESTGKEGRGIVPVVNEPLMSPKHYGSDRLFAYLQVDGDDNEATDKAMKKLESAGQPVVKILLPDVFDLGAEFFRWEFATAVAGHVLGVHPFDQPNVQRAKEKTDQEIDRYYESGRRPSRKNVGSLSEMLASAGPGDYLAIQAYVRETPETNKALHKLRRTVLEEKRIATTVGYGPAYLHSTGQLHKAGPDSGMFLQLTSQERIDMEIPHEQYSFRALLSAQAEGDLETLQASGRRVARIVVNMSDIESLSSLVSKAN